MNTVKCPDCSALVPDIEGETHPYLGGSAGCWKLYGELLAKEYSDPAYFSVHRFTVDAYAVQHPGRNERRANQSVNAHLISLCLILENNVSVEYATKAIGKSIESLSNDFQRLSPPNNFGEVVITDVLTARGCAEHKKITFEWARSAWRAWSPHHETIRRYADLVLKKENA